MLTCLFLCLRIWKLAGTQEHRRREQIEPDSQTDTPTPTGSRVLTTTVFTIDYWIYSLTPFQLAEYEYEVSRHGRHISYSARVQEFNQKEPAAC